MLSKEVIIDNISQYSAHEIVRFLMERILTINEIIEGNGSEFDFRKRLDIESLLWGEAESSNEASLLKIYLENYPSGLYKERALESLNRNPAPSPPPLQPEASDLFVPDPTPLTLEDPWEATDKKSIIAIREFLSSNEAHPKAREARMILNSLRKKADLPHGPEWFKQELKNTASKDPDVIFNVVKEACDSHRISNAELRSLFAEDWNILPLEVVKNMVEQGYISTFDLEEAGINSDFVSVIDGNYPQLIDRPVKTQDMVNPDKINQVCQEIYFWGMPSSGKTCALGAIMSAASTGAVAKTIQRNNDCHGLDYMRQLSLLFQPGKISKLPTGTMASNLFDMGFWLLDDHNKLHSLTLIDLAGEMLEVMYLVNQGRSHQLTPDQVTGYNCMLNLLVDKASKNSKIHFFVLEYGGHDREEKGLRQVDMLEGALSHIIDLGILSKTDAVYILMTKADKALKDAQNRDVNEVLKEYVKTHYQAFYNGLKLNARKINGGVIEMIPFTIGDVCFQDLCRFDDSQANYMVKLFLDRTVGERAGRLGSITNTFRG